MSEPKRPKRAADAARPTLYRVRREGDAFAVIAPGEATVATIHGEHAKRQAASLAKRMNRAYQDGMVAAAQAAIGDDPPSELASLIDAYMAGYTKAQSLVEDKP